MKTLLLIVFLGTSVFSFSQSISCQKLFQIVTKEYDSKRNQSILMSSMLAKADYYRLDNIGFVVAYIKSNEYDFNGQPYIFCGISQSRWNSFVNAGILDSWGKSFHQYIRDYTCDCN